VAISIAAASLAVALASAVGAVAWRKAPLKRRVALGLVAAAAVPAAVFAYAQAPYEVVTRNIKPAG
jgi:hypothetical protein